MHASLAFPLCFLIAIHMAMSPFAAVPLSGVSSCAFCCREDVYIHCNPAAAGLQCTVFAFLNVNLSFTLYLSLMTSPTFSLE